jgi:hypothetical protein
MLAGMEMLASAGVDPSLFNSLLTSKAGGSHWWSAVFEVSFIANIVVVGVQRGPNPVS